MSGETPCTQREEPTGFVPFPADRAQSYRAAGYWAGRPLDSLLRVAATSWPERTAVIDDAVRYSYAELDTRADRCAAGFAALGIRAGDRVLVQLPNSCQFAVALFGLLRVGAIPVLCLPGHRGAELGHLGSTAGAVALVITDADGGFDYREMAATVARSVPGLRHVIVDGAAGPFIPFSRVTEFAGARIDSGPVDTSGPALLLVSGGTTGFPKLIPRTHDDYLYNATASAALCRLQADDVYLAVLPAAHNFPLACPGLLGALSVGAATVFTKNPSPESAFTVIDRHRVTVTALVPALAKVWARAVAWEPLAPSNLRLLQVGGAKLGAEDAATVRRTLTPGLQQVFGMAEGLLNYTRIGDPPGLVDHTQGRPLSEADEVLVVDETGAEVGAGEEGELLVRGPYTLNGYFNAPAVNERSFSPGGFYRSGDKVRRCAGGYLEVTGRVKDVIHRGGETVSARDLEEHLLDHPAIWSAAAVALPDDYLGEKICAAVVFSGTVLTLAELHRFLDERGVAVHARPDLLEPMASLPTTAVGKVDKRAIIAALTSSRR